MSRLLPILVGAGIIYAIITLIAWAVVLAILYALLKLVLLVFVVVSVGYLVFGVLTLFLFLFDPNGTILEKGPFVWWRSIDPGLRTASMFGAGIFLVVGLIYWNTGLSDGVSCPNIEVQYRSAFGPGYKMIIFNRGSSALENLAVKAPNWSRPSVVCGSLPPGDSVSVGWMELPESVKLGRTYQISADGFLGWKSVTMPRQ